MFFDQGTFINDATKETPETLKRKREAIRQALSGVGRAQYVGEGFADLLTGVVGGFQRKKLNKTESAEREKATEAFNTGIGSWSPFSGGQMYNGGFTGAGGTPSVTGSEGGDNLGLPSSLEGAPDSLIRTESGGNWQAQNNVMGAGGKAGHFGRVQFGQARLDDAMRAGAIPKGTTPQQFMASPELQMAAERWHFGDINRQIDARGLDRFIGQDVNGDGVPETRGGMVAMAHLGGTGGMAKFLTSGGRYDPADAYGTSLSDYARTHAGPIAPNAVGRPLPEGFDASSAEQRGPYTPPANMPQNMEMLLSGGSELGQEGEDMISGGGGTGSVMGQQGYTLPPQQQAQPQPFTPAPMPGYNGPDMQTLMGLAQNPWLTPEQRGIVSTYMQQAQQANDPMRQMQWQRQQYAMEADRRRLAQGSQPDAVVINGQLVDKRTGEVLGDYRTAGGSQDLPASIVEAQWRAEQAGLKPGTQEYQDFILNGGGDPATFRALDMQAQAAGYEPGTQEYANFMATRGAGQQAYARGTGQNQANIDTGGDAARTVEAGKVTGRQEAENAASADGVVQRATSTYELVDSILTDPALDSITGKVQGRMDPNGVTGLLMGQGAVDLAVKVEQLQGKAFLEAFESLKGGGQITEREGIAAQNAIARLQRVQSEEAFREGLLELRTIADNARRRARGEQVPEYVPADAGGAPVAGASTPAAPADERAAFLADPRVQQVAKDNGVTPEEMWEMKQRRAGNG